MPMFPADCAVMRPRQLLSVILFVAVTVPLMAQDPVPTGDALTRATKEVQALLREQPKRGPSALAVSLIESASTARDPVERYVYLREALDTASKAGDSTIAISAMEMLTKGFAVNALTERAELGIQLSRQAKQVVDASVTAQFVIGLCRQAIIAGDDVLAARLATAATALNARHKDAALTALAKDLPAWVNEVTASRKALPAGDLLGTMSPSDATAIGRHTCLLLGEWKKGLPILARGDDAQLSKLAASDVANSGETAQAIALADGWWTVSEKLRGFSRTLVQRHAESWYRTVLPKLTGITRSRVDQRLAELPFDVLSNPGSVDLWPLMSLAKGSYQGEWKNVNGVLVVEKNDAGDHVTIPVVPFGDYRLESTFEQLSDKGEVMFLIPVMAGDGPHSLNYFLYDDGSAFHLINDDMVSSTSPRGRITPKTRHTFVAEVKQGEQISIVLHLDGHEIFRWKGPANTSFGNHRKAKPTKPGALGLGAWNASAAFYNARFTPLSGRVGRLEDLAAP
jgi:hypothetical protein